MVVKCLIPRTTWARAALGGSTGSTRTSRVRATVAPRKDSVRLTNRSSFPSSRRDAAVARVVPPEVVAAAVDPFGVSAEQWELIEGNLFGASLLPYLAFLYYLGKPEVQMPPRALFGFKFLLAFVFGTIPCAIFAKLRYDDILANVDWLHGPAESLLTVTNLLIVVGMREGLREARGSGGGGGGGGGSLDGKKTVDGSSVGAALLGWSAFAATAALASGAGGAGIVYASEANASASASAASFLSEVSLLFGSHAEPPNALSLPTWVIHVSSLIEWLVAMGLIWEYADVTGNQAYKGLTWGMVPCHASGVAACTFHVFYNAPVLSAVVATQAGLTVVGNTTCAFAAYRMAKAAGANVAMPWEEGFEGLFPGKTGRGDVDGDVDSTSLGASSWEGGGDVTEDPGGPFADASATRAKKTTHDGSFGREDLSAASSRDSDAVLIAKLFVVSTSLSAVVKWGSLAVDFPFEPSVGLAFLMIFGPTALNVAKWNRISARDGVERRATR